MIANPKPTVLVVEDNPELLDFIAEDLGESFTVVKALHGLAALQQVEKTAFDLIVSDVMMPHMDGHELCQRLKADVAYCHIPFVMLTAKNSITAKIEGLELGADAYIEKPFSPDFLLAQINSLLRNRKNIRDYFSKSPLAHIQSMGQNSGDQRFLEKLNELIVDNIQSNKLNVDTLADLMCMSRPTLYRKIKSITDLSPNDLINITRLKKAAALLIANDMRIYQISDLVGYSSAGHFSRNFHKQFGMTPKEFIATANKNNS